MLMMLPVAAMSFSSKSAETSPSKQDLPIQVKVNAGDTLWSIAYRYRPDTKIPMAQMMRAIYARNPHAFYNKQLTSLKADTQLTIPDNLDNLLPPAKPIVTESRHIAAAPLVLTAAAQAPDSTIDKNRSAIQKSRQSSKGTTLRASQDAIANDPVINDSANLVIDGFLAAEFRYFPQSAAYNKQIDQQWSGVAQLDFYLPWNDEYDAVSFSPFYRKDSEDPQRSHFDVRELKYLHVGDDWEIHLGIDRVFWGVTETQHLVDIVNQTDWVEAPDGEDKLGQPMVHLSTLHDWGTLDFFVLPYFRERTYPWWQGRLRGPLPVNTDVAFYESDDEQHHIDYALRWNHMLGDWEMAVSAFSGTSREPILRQQLDSSGAPELVPFYPQINQLGLETLYINGSWIWKLEAIRREGNLIDNYYAADFGFEYTFYGVNESAIDVGWLMEFQYDSRGELASMAQKDLFIGTRLAFNDVDGSEILAGIAQDLEFSDSRSLLIEAKTRVNANWTANLDLWLFSSNQPQDYGYMIRQDDFIQFSLELHF
ncbi:FimV/HubP family polar landmark protein [Neptunicella sp. SCSIO 80796]|uniref:FimV/HubP family polar landmark protein n=1 Tax=Neptunicella plasticusilytica TaxID=3117012 RepID=UPI003A4D1FD4